MGTENSRSMAFSCDHSDLGKDNNMQSDSQPLDLVCIGFGITALSIAIALHERQSLDNTLFLESQPQSSWKPCPDIPATRLRTSFLNDLITSENPRSKFTFMNYLQATNRTGCSIVEVPRRRRI